MTTAYKLSHPIMIILVVLLFFSATAAYAQAPLVRHFDTLDKDTNGKALVRPFFAQYDQVMDEIYVIDSLRRIIIYTSDLFPIITLDKSNNIELPVGLAVAPDGTLYVAQSITPEVSRHRVSVFNPCLKWERDIFFEGFEGAESFKPYRIALDKSGNIYIAGIRFPGIIVLDSNYNLIEIMAPDEGDKKANLINVTIDDKGWIYLVSEEEGHIYVYDENREFIFQFGTKGGSYGKLSRPRGVVVDNLRGWIYVVDYMRHTINTYNKNGNSIFEFGGMGWSEGWFRFPTDISINKDGDVMVTDLFNQRIQIFKPY